MVTGTYAKSGEMQFWGTSQNPFKGPGTAFHADCCPCECYTFRDDFDREDSTDLGTDWEECIGDWRIESERLVIDEEGIVVLKHMVGPPVGIFQIMLRDVAVGTIVSIRAYYGSESTPCSNTTSWKLRFTRDTSSTALFELVAPGGEVMEDFPVSGSLTDEVSLSLCVGPERIVGDSNYSQDMLACSCTSGMPGGACSFSGYWFAIENESEETVEVEWAYYSDHRWHDATCPQCLCGCEGHCLPDELIATLRDYSDCTRQEGKEFRLYRQPWSCVWKMDPAREDWEGTPADDCCIQLELNPITASEEYSPPSNWKLRDMTNPSSDQNLPAQVGSTCNPIYLLFGPYRNNCDSPIGDGNWRCCEGDSTQNWPYGIQGLYLIEITEP